VDDSVLQVVRNVIDRHGAEICDDHRRVEALLRDLCPANRKEVTLLARAVAEGAVADIRDWQGSVPREALVRKIAKKLEETLAITESAALWTASGWSEILSTVPEPHSPAWHEFKGNGSGNVECDLKFGVWVFDGQQEGDGVFSAVLKSRQGEFVSLPVNVLGRRRSSKAVIIDSTDHFFLEVYCNAAWRILARASSVHHGNLRKPPLNFRGTGQQCFGPLQFEQGVFKAILEFLGSGNFIVSVISTEGVMEMVENEVGPVKSSKELRRNSDSFYFLDVLGEGEWTVVLS
jgi:hypothetical protein